MLEPGKQHFKKKPIFFWGTNISCSFLQTDKAQIVMCLEIHIGLAQKMEVCIAPSCGEGGPTGANSSTLVDPCGDTDWRENCLQISTAGAACGTLNTPQSIFLSIVGNRLRRHFLLVYNDVHLPKITCTSYIIDFNVKSTLNIQIFKQHGS